MKHDEKCCQNVLQSLCCHGAVYKCVVAKEVTSQLQTSVSWGGAILLDLCKQQEYTCLGRYKQVKLTTVNWKIQRTQLRIILDSLSTQVLNWTIKILKQMCMLQNNIILKYWLTKSTKYLKVIKLIYWKL